MAWQRTGPSTPATICPPGGPLRAFRVFRDRFAQPICRTDYRETTPEIATPVTGLFLTDSCQLHPHDRTISGAFELSSEAARLALERVGARGSHVEA